MDPLLEQAYIDAAIRAGESIDWDTLVEAGFQAGGPDGGSQVFLTRDATRLIQENAMEPPESTVEMLETENEETMAFVRALFHVCHSVSSVRVRRFVLAVLMQLLRHEGVRESEKACRAICGANGDEGAGVWVDQLLKLRRTTRDVLVLAWSSQVAVRLAVASGGALLTDDSRAADLLLWCIEALDRGRDLLRRERREEDALLKRAGEKGAGKGWGKEGKRSEAPVMSVARAMFGSQSGGRGEGGGGGGGGGAGDALEKGRILERDASASILSGGMGASGSGGERMMLREDSSRFDLASSKSADVLPRVLAGERVALDADASLGAALRTLMIAFRAASLRHSFLAESGIRRLLPLLSSSDPQRQYEAAFCLWALALDEQGVKELREAEEGFARLGDVVRIGSIPIKVVRMALGALARSVANLTDPSTNPKEAEYVLPLLHEAAPHLEAEIDAILSSKRVIEDPELKADAETVREALESGATELTTVARWRRELDAGRMRWGPAHTPEFWAEHCATFEANGAELLRRLAALLADPAASPTTLAVAASDAGEFAAQHPNGKYIATRVGLKEKVLLLVKHHEPQVCRQALLALSKMMISKWQYLQAH